MNRVVHYEIHAKDMDKMQKFYNEVFGWEITDMGAQFGNYRTIVSGKSSLDDKWPGINGGMTPRQGELPVDGQAVNAFVCTINVENIDEHMEKVKNAGGTLSLDKMDVPGVGKLAYMKDPEGNIFGMLQPQ